MSRCFFHVRGGRAFQPSSTARIRRQVARRGMIFFVVLFKPAIGCVCVVPDLPLAWFRRVNRPRPEECSPIYFLSIWHTGGELSALYTKADP